MSKSVSNELKTVIASRIDELYDAVRAKTISVPDATVVIHDQLSEIIGAVYTLNKKYLDRMYVILGVTDVPSMRNQREIKSARDFVQSFLFPDDASAVVSVSDGENEDLDEFSDQPDVENDNGEEKKQENSKKKSKSVGDRTSPRKPVSADRAVRAAITELADITAIRAELIKINQENAAKDEQLRLLQKENEVRKQKENDDLVAALNAMPKIDTSKHGKNGKKKEKRAAKSKKIAPVSHSIHLQAPKAPIDSSDSDTSSSDSSSDGTSSSSSSSVSSSSDSDRKSRRRRRKHRSKRSSDRHSKGRHAKAFFKNVGRDGCLIYLNRIIAQVTADHSKVDVRSKHEAEALANALDALMVDGAKLKWDGIEVLVTRLIGVIYAIQTGEWTVATAIQFNVAGNATLPLSSSQMAKLAKRGERIKSLTSTAPKRTNGKNNSGADGSTPSTYKKYQSQNSGSANAKAAVGSAGTGSEKASSKAQ